MKYGVGIPHGGSGARQIGRGIKQGVAAARASLAETAVPEAAAAAEAPASAAVPAEPPTPVTAPTDEALVHLYSVETDPAKRAALQAQLVDRGLMNQPAAAAPETNPYRGYSQDALQKVYAIEPDAAKRTLIEQAARDRNLTLLNREGRRATAAVPETGFTEPPGPSLTQDDALMLHYLGETDPASASVETIGIARKLAADNPELLNRLRAGEGATEPISSPPTPAAPSRPGRATDQRRAAATASAHGNPGAGRPRCQEAAARCRPPSQLRAAAAAALARWRDLTRTRISRRLPARHTPHRRATTGRSSRQKPGSSSNTSRRRRRTSQPLPHPRHRRPRPRRSRLNRSATSCAVSKPRGRLS